MRSKLNEVTAYQAMIAFLERYYGLTNSDEIGALLGSMQLLGDGEPADRGMWEEWLQAVNSVQKHERIAS